MNYISTFSQNQPPMYNKNNHINSTFNEQITFYKGIIQDMNISDEIKKDSIHKLHELYKEYRNHINKS